MAKNEVSRLKVVPRTGLAAKKRSFSPQNADENGSRRQKKEFFTSK
jgi:hypothetical protein